MINKYAILIKKLDEAAIDKTITIKPVLDNLRYILENIKSHEDFLSKINPD